MEIENDMNDTSHLEPHPTFSLLWLGILLFLVLCIAFYAPISPNDYWWYVRLGQEITSWGQIPTVDAFSSTRAGEPMVYHSWLSAVIFWTVYNAGGLTLTFVLRGVVLAIFYATIWKLCRETGLVPQLATLVMVVAVLATMNNWAVRPQLLVYPLFGLYVFILWRELSGRDSAVWVLPLLMALWVNLHGSFVLGFLLVGAAFVTSSAHRKKLLAVLVGLFVASLVNPRGWEAWTYVLSLLTDASSQEYSREWFAPSASSFVGKVFFVWLLAFSWLTSRSSRQLTWTQWLWFFGFGWLALSGFRYVVWFVVLLASFSAYLLVPLTPVRLQQAVAETEVKPRANIAIVTMLLLLSLLMLPDMRKVFWEESPNSWSDSTPVAATAWLAEQAESLPGPMWADLDFASYHVFALPQYPVWIDTRFELYPVEHWERYLDIGTAVPNWQELLDEEGINLLLLNPSEQERLIQAVELHPQDWVLCYEDETAVLFVRAESTPPNVCLNVDNE